MKERKHENSAPLNTVSFEKLFDERKVYAVWEWTSVAEKRMNAYSLCHISHYRINSWADTVTGALHIDMRYWVWVGEWICLDSSSRLRFELKCFYYVSHGWGLKSSFFSKKKITHTQSRIKYIKDFKATNHKQMWYVFELGLCTFCVCVPTNTNVL